MNIHTTGEALRILLEEGQLSLKKHPEAYKAISSDWDEFYRLNELANAIGLYVVNYRECYYVSALPKSKTFSYSNEELRREMGSQFNNVDMYLVLLIMAILVTEVCPDGTEPKVSMVSFNDYVTCVEKRFNHFNSLDDLERLSVEGSYNLYECVNRWNELLPVVRNRNGDVSEKGKNSRYQICMATIRFMEKQKLVRLGGSDGKTVYVLDRFKAIVSNTYNGAYVQNQIFDTIQSAGRRDLHD